jgi:hypothetical protein
MALIHFVVVTGRPAAVDRLSARLADALECTRLFDGGRVERRGVSGTWAAAAIGAPDRVCGQRLAASEDAIVIVNGPALDTRGSQAELASTALQTFGSSGTEGVAARLGGSFNFVGVAPTIGARAFVDLSGLTPLYWHEEADAVVFSNRSTTIERLTNRAEWDLRALAWVIGHANLFDAHMPARGVSYVAPGHQVEVAWGEGTARVARSPAWIWPAPSSDRGRDDLSAAEWDDVTDALVAHFRVLRHLDGPLRMDITGGKDSRLGLSLAHAAGLHDRVIAATSGAYDSPEVACAADVAAAVGFEHDRRRAPETPANEPPPVTRPAPFDADSVWSRLRSDVYRYEAIVCAWSALQNSSAPALNIKGFGGELYRRGNAAQFRRAHVEDLDTLASMFVNYHQVHDPLGILRASEAAYQVDWLKSWVYNEATNVRADLLPEKFYVDHRLGHWSGPLIQSAPRRVNVNPLLLTAAAKKNMELSSAARADQRFHFEVMRRAAPELVGLPFLNDTWPKGILERSPVAVATEPFPTPEKPIGRVITGRNQGWPLMEHESKAIAALFKDARRQTDMGEICDMWKLRRVARVAGQLRASPRVKELHSAIGAALALLGRGEPVLDRL